MKRILSPHPQLINRTLSRWLYFFSALFLLNFMNSLAWADTPSRELPDVKELSNPTPGSWTMVLLPDSQYYFDHTKDFRPKPEVFGSMIDWIIANKEQRNIGILLHVGDIVDNNTPEEWEMAHKAFEPLNGVLPYVITTGNHEYTGASRIRETMLNDYFKTEDNALNDPQKGGILAQTMEPDSLENAVYDWQAPDGRKFAIFALEWGVRNRVVDWANEVLQAGKYDDHTAVLLVHAYLYHDNTRFDWEAYGKDQSANPHSYGTAKTEDNNDGRQLWTKLVKPHKPFEFVFCGHVSGTMAQRAYYDFGSEVAYLRSTGKNGNAVHQMLFNAQRRGDAGEGWLRLLEFQPDGKTVVVKTYSPWRDERGLAAWRTDPDNYFQLQLSPMQP